MRRTDTASFEQFVRLRGAALLRTAHLLSPAGLGEDLLQESLERLARHWHRLDGDPESYARRVMANRAVDGWRYRARQPQERYVSTDEAVDPDVANVVGRHRDVIAALRKLPARQRAVLVLRYFDDLTEAQVASMLGVTVGTVKSTAAKALQRLRAQGALNDYLPRVDVRGRTQGDDLL